MLAFELNSTWNLYIPKSDVWRLRGLCTTPAVTSQQEDSLSRLRPAGIVSTSRILYIKLYVGSVCT